MATRHGYRVVARLWTVPGQQEGFRRFEKRAFGIMAEHGGEVLEIRHGSVPGDPAETHVLMFPDRAAFDAYRADSRLAALADLRETCIARTEVDLPPD